MNQVDRLYNHAIRLFEHGDHAEALRTVDIVIRRIDGNGQISDRIGSVLSLRVIILIALEKYDEAQSLSNFINDELFQMARDLKLPAQRLELYTALRVALTSFEYYVQLKTMLNGYQEYYSALMGWNHVIGQASKLCPLHEIIMFQFMIRLYLAEFYIRTADFASAKSLVEFLATIPNMTPLIAQRIEKVQNTLQLACKGRALVDFVKSPYRLCGWCRSMRHKDDFVRSCERCHDTFNHTYYCNGKCLRAHWFSGHILLCGTKEERDELDRWNASLARYKCAICTKSATISCPMCMAHFYCGHKCRGQAWATGHNKQCVCIADYGGK